MSIIVPDFLSIRSQIANNLISVFGLDLNVASNSPTGQIIDLIANSYLQLWQKLQAVDTNGNAQQAQGQSLDNLLTLINVFRDNGTKTKILNVTLSGTPGTIIEAGSFCSTSSGNRFYTASSVSIGLFGIVIVDFFAEFPGAIVVKAHELNTIATMIPGWNAVDNGSDGITGLAKVPDSTLRANIPKLVNQYSLGYMGVLYAKIYQNSSVINAFVYENDRTTVSPPPYFSPPNTLWAILFYEDSTQEQQIANSILAGKSAVSMYSKTTATQVIKYANDMNGLPHLITWNRAVIVPLYVTVKVLVSSQLTIDVSVVIKDLLIKYILENRRISITLFWTKFLCSISDVDPAVVIENFWVSKTFPPTSADVIDVPLNFDEIFDLVEQNITIIEE
jgi:uncharacterized phage protein gp47/JayE